MTFSVSARDSDDPAQSVTYEKMSGPGTVHATTGEYTWNVPVGTPVSTVDVVIRVKDNGSPFETHDVVVPIAIMHGIEATRKKTPPGSSSPRRRCG